MTKEELIKLSRENLRKSKQGSLCECYDEAFIKGYELSEKRIEELEKENKVLAQNLEDTEILNKAYEKRFDDLEKENAELKDYRLTTLAKQQTGMSKYALNLEHKLSWYDDQLTKAKEIIKKLISDNHKVWVYSDVREEAEQFLNSEGK